MFPECVTRSEVPYSSPPKDRYFLEEFKGINRRSGDGSQELMGKGSLIPA